MAKRRTGGISKRHALDARELNFVKTFSALGEKNSAEAYRRAYLVELGGKWYEPDAKGAADPTKEVEAREANKRAQALKKLDHIQGWIEELRGAPGDHARQVMADAVLFTNDATALKAAEKVLADEDKLSFREDVEWHTEVLCAIGTEVVFELDGVPTTVPLTSLFPQFAEATPPVAVIEKTIRTLEMMRDARVAADASDA